MIQTLILRFRIWPSGCHAGAALKRGAQDDIQMLQMCRFSVGQTSRFPQNEGLLQAAESPKCRSPLPIRGPRAVMNNVAVRGPNATKRQTHADLGPVVLKFRTPTPAALLAVGLVQMAPDGSQYILSGFVCMYGARPRIYIYMSFPIDDQPTRDGTETTWTSNYRTGQSWAAPDTGARTQKDPAVGLICALR